MGWLEIYKRDISKHKSLDAYVNYKIKNKRVFIDLVQKYAINKRIIEAGSGTGILSTYMAGIGYNVTTVDIDKDILKLSKEIAEGYKSVNKPIFKIKSIFNLNFKKNAFDVCMSNGVLEHFSDEQIIDSLKQQMKIAKTVIFGIPTQYFKQKEAMFGDERYLSLDYWRYIIDKADGIILEEKSMKYFTLRERIFKFNKYFKTSPFRIFVIQQKN